MSMIRPYLGTQTTENLHYSDYELQTLRTVVKRRNYNYCFFLQSPPCRINNKSLVGKRGYADGLMELKTNLGQLNQLYFNSGQPIPTTKRIYYNSPQRTIVYYDRDSWRGSVCQILRSQVWRVVYVSRGFNHKTQ